MNKTKHKLVLQDSLVWRRNWYENLSHNSLCFQHCNTSCFLEQQSNKLKKKTNNNTKSLLDQHVQKPSYKDVSGGDTAVFIKAAAEMSCIPSGDPRQEKLSFAV